MKRAQMIAELDPKLREWLVKQLEREGRTYRAWLEDQILNYKSEIELMRKELREYQRSGKTVPRRIIKWIGGDK